MARTAKKLSFEAAISELEEVVTSLERGDCTLEEMLQQYTKGISLLKECNAQLDKAEKAVDKLLTKECGQVKEAPLVVEEE